MMVLALRAALALAASTTPVHAADIQHAYVQMLRVEAVAIPGRDSVFGLRVDPPAPGTLLAGFYRDHELWFDYMVQNGRGIKVPLIDRPAPPGFLRDGARAAAAHSQQLLRDGIVNDTAFNGVVLPAIAAYLRAAGVPVDPRIAPPQKRAIAMDTVVKRAVRFFYPDILDATGIHTHVCTQLNAIRELPQRDPALEAMAFSAIMTDVQRDSSVIAHDFSAAIARMKELDAPGAADSVRLRRAQGVMWALMSESTELRALLDAQARRESTILPFTISAARASSATERTR